MGAKPWHRRIEYAIVADEGDLPFRRRRHRGLRLHRLGRELSPSNSGNDSVGPTRGFADGGALIFTCTSQGVYRSADNGATWSQKSAGITDPRTSGIIYTQGSVIVVTPSGVFRSADQGDTWQTAGLEKKDVRCIAAIQGVLVAGTNGEGIYRSVDLGKNWVAANTGLNSGNFRAIETKGTTLFAAGGVGSGVFRSTDQGLSWTLLTNGLPSSSYRGFASNSQLIVAGSFGAGVFYSTNNGDTGRPSTKDCPISPSSISNCTRPTSWRPPIRREFSVSRSPI